MKNLIGIALLGALFIATTAFSPSNNGYSGIEKTEKIAEGKHTSTIVVYKNGKKVGSGYKVSMEFVGGFLPGGFTKNFYTNSDGVAYVEHASEGTVKVYVDGNWSNHKTKGKAPGKIIVYL